MSKYKPLITGIILFLVSFGSAVRFDAQPFLRGSVGQGIFFFCLCAVSFFGGVLFVSMFLDREIIQK